MVNVFKTPTKFNTVKKDIMKFRRKFNLVNFILIIVSLSLILIALFTCSYDGSNSSNTTQQVQNPLIPQVNSDSNQNKANQDESSQNKANQDESSQNNQDEESKDQEKDSNGIDFSDIDQETLINRFLPVAIIIVIAIILFFLIKFLLNKLSDFLIDKFKKDEKTKEESENNIKSIINLISTLLRLTILVVAILISLNILDLIKFPQFTLSALVNWLLGSGINILVTILAIYVFLRLTTVIIDRVKISVLSKYENETTLERIDKIKRAETLSKLAGYILRVIIWVSGVLTILGQFNVNVAPLLASAGIIGVAIGFGSQNLIKDVLQGAFILIENQYHVGDVVKIAGVAGIVEDFNIRYTRMRNLSGSVFFIPNGEIKVVENMTKEWSRALLDFQVAYKEDVDRVMTIIKEVADGLLEEENYKNRILEPMEILGVEELADSGVTIRTLIKTIPLQQWDIGRELRRRVKNEFDKQGIEIPFPHVTLAIGEEASHGTINVYLKELAKKMEKFPLKFKDEESKDQDTHDKKENKTKTDSSASVYGDEHTQSDPTEEGADDGDSD